MKIDVFSPYSPLLFITPQISKIINETYKSFNSHQFPLFVLNLTMDTRLFDINVTPDKRTLMLQNEHLLIDQLKVKLAEM